MQEGARVDDLERGIADYGEKKMIGEKMESLMAVCISKCHRVCKW